MKFIMWLNVINGSDVSKGFFGPSRLFYKPIESIQIPEPGVDDVILYPGEDDDGTQTEGPMWQVKSRYMGHQGKWHIELSQMVLDPNEHWQNSMRSRIAASRKVVTDKSWYTDRDGDPYPDLIRGGWREYNSATWTKDNN